MIRLAYYNIENLDLKKGYELVPDKRKEKIDFYRFDKDKKLSCGAYLLLQKELNEEGIINPEFEIGKYGKAYISNYEDIYFNISHSGKIVIAKNYFYNSEYENIMKSSLPSNEFFKYWVLKESYMKYTGLGFNLDLNSFEIIIDKEIKLKNDKNNIKFNLFDLGEYKLASAGHFKTKNIRKYGQLY